MHGWLSIAAEESDYNTIIIILLLNIEGHNLINIEKNIIYGISRSKQQIFTLRATSYISHIIKCISM